MTQTQERVFEAEALQVLTSAQRTAAEHIAAANRHCDKIKEDARAAADQLTRDAQVHVHGVRLEADKALAEAREQAARIVRAAEEQAEQLELRAKERYEDSVGGLSARRELLQQQIEGLERFDREYRGRLARFMQGQMRALWADNPKVRTGNEDSVSEDIDTPVE